MRVAKWLPRGEDFPRRAGPRPWERAEVLLFAALAALGEGTKLQKIVLFAPVWNQMLREAESLYTKRS